MGLDRIDQTMMYEAFDSLDDAAGKYLSDSTTTMTVRSRNHLLRFEEWTGASSLGLFTTNGGTRMWAPFRGHITAEHFRTGTATLDQFAVERAIGWAAVVAATEPWYSTPDRTHGTPMVLTGGGHVYDLFRTANLTTNLSGSPALDCAGLTIRDLSINMLDVAPSGQALGWIDSDPWTGWTFRATNTMTAEQVEAAARHCFYRPRRRSFAFDMSGQASRINIENLRLNCNNMGGGVHLSSRSKLINSRIVRNAGWGVRNRGGDSWVLNTEICQWQIDQDPQYYDPNAYTGCGVYGPETDLRIEDCTIFWLREGVRSEATNNRARGGHWFNGSQGYLASTREDPESGAATTEEWREAVFDYFKGIEDPQADAWTSPDDVLTHDFTPRTYNPALVMATPMTLEEYEEAGLTDTPVKTGKQRLMDFRLRELYMDNAHIEVFGGALVIDALDTGFKATSSLNEERPYVYGLYGFATAGRAKLIIDGIDPMVESANIGEDGIARHMVKLLTGPFGETHLTGGTTDDNTAWNADWSVNTHRTRGNNHAGFHFSFMSPHTFVQAHWNSDADPTFRMYGPSTNSRGIGFADRLTSRGTDGEDATPLWHYIGSSGDVMVFGQQGAPAGPAMQLDNQNPALKLQPQAAEPDVPNNNWIAQSDGTASTNGFGDDGAGLYEKVGGDWWKVLNSDSTLDSAKVAVSGGGSLEDWRDRETRADVIAFVAGKTPYVGRTIGWKGGFRIRYMGALYVAGLSDAPQWVPDGEIWGDHFNVVYDGTTDCRSAVREAFTYAGGQELHFGSGTVRIVPIAAGTTAVQSPAALTKIIGHGTTFLFDPPDDLFYAMFGQSAYVTWEGCAFTDDAPDGAEIAYFNISSGGRFEQCKVVSDVVNDGGSPSKSVYWLNFSASTDFTDLDLIDIEMRQINFGPLKTNAATSDHARINCTRIKAFDVWYCPLMFNSPNGEMTDITMRDIYAENYESVDSERHVLGVATGNTVIVDGVTARGDWWEVLHFEENVRNLIVTNINAEITNGDVIGLLANDVATDAVLRRPEQVTISNVNGEKLGTRGGTCIKFTYDAKPIRSADRVVVNTFTAKNFEYGAILGLGALENVRISDGILIGCQYGIRYAGNFQGYAGGMTFIDCDVGIKADNGGVIHNVAFDACDETHEVTNGALLIHNAKWNFGSLNFTAGETKWFRLFKRLSGSKGSLAVKAYFGTGQNHHVVATIDWDGSTEAVSTLASVSTGGAITATPALIDEASAVAIAAGGTGYTVGDVLTVSGGTLETNGTRTTATVTAESSGVVTAVSLTNPGEWATVPSNAVSTTGGTGSGCTLNLTTVKTMACRVYDSGARTGTRITAELTGWALVR